MSIVAEELRGSKISSEFAARLQRLGPEDRIRAILLLQIPEPEEQSTLRQSGVDRKKAIERTRASSQEGLDEID